MGIHRILVVLLTFSIPCLAEAQARWEFVEFSVETELVPSPVSVGILLPPDYSPEADPYPMLLMLHGGANPVRRPTPHRQLDGRLRPMIEEAWSSGSLPSVVAVMPATGMSFYVDYRDGTQLWETFIMDELIPYLRERFNIVPSRTGSLVWGSSMGGMGALRFAFKHLDEFEAVAAMQAGIEPALEFDDIDSNDPIRRVRPDELYEEKYGRPADRAYWRQNHPISIANDNIDLLKESGLQIYVEVGDEDQNGLFRGAEMLHRILFDAGIQHEYRLVHGARHGGPMFPDRTVNSLEFLGRVLEPVRTDGGQ